MAPQPTDSGVPRMRGVSRPSPMPPRSFVRPTARPRKALLLTTSRSPARLSFKTISSHVETSPPLPSKLPRRTAMPNLPGRREKSGANCITPIATRRLHVAGTPTSVTCTPKPTGSSSRGSISSAALNKPLPSPPIAQVIDPGSPIKASRTLVDASVRLSTGHDSTELKEIWPAIPPENISTATETTQETTLSDIGNIPYSKTFQQEFDLALPSTPVEKSTQNCQDTPKEFHRPNLDTAPGRSDTEPVTGKSDEFPIIKVTSPSEATLKLSLSQDFIGDGADEHTRGSNEVATSRSSSTDGEEPWRSPIYSCRRSGYGSARLPSRAPHSTSSRLPALSNKTDEFNQQNRKAISGLSQYSVDSSSKVQLARAQSTRGAKDSTSGQSDNRGSIAQQDVKKVPPIRAMRPSGHSDALTVATQSKGNVSGQGSIGKPVPTSYSRIPHIPRPKGLRSPPPANGAVITKREGSTLLLQQVDEAGSGNENVGNMEMEPPVQSSSDVKLENRSALSPPLSSPPISLTHRSFSDPDPASKLQGQQCSPSPAAGKETIQMEAEIELPQAASALGSHPITVEYSLKGFLDERKSHPEPAGTLPAPSTLAHRQRFSQARQSVSKDVGHRPLQAPGDAARNNPNSMRGTIKQSIRHLFQKHEKVTRQNVPKVAQDKKPSSARIPKTPSIIDRFIPSASMRGRTPSRTQTTKQSERSEPKNERRGGEVGHSCEPAERLKMLEIAQVVLNAMENAKRSEISAQQAEAYAREAKIQADMARLALHEIKSMVGYDMDSIGDILALLQQSPAAC